MSSHSYDILPRLRPRVPAASIAHAQSWDPTREPVAARASASVAVIRDGRHGLQTYLLQRQASMPFAPLMSVFPGGGVEPADDPRDARRCCAVRETREETGIRLDPGELLPWAHWITPVYAPVRFDTTFFLAVCPAGQEAQNLSGEADSAAWWGLQDALDAHQLGALGLLPPTLSVVLELADCATAAAAVERSRHRVVAPVLPALHLDGDTARFRYPTLVDGPPR